jgi:hypothetical protein
MTGAPSVCWFWPNPSIQTWTTPGEKCRAIVGCNEPGAPFLGRIATNDLISAAQSLLKST